jgi:hypothetical protein
MGFLKRPRSLTNIPRLIQCSEVPQLHTNQVKAPAKRMSEPTYPTAFNRLINESPQPVHASHALIKTQSLYGSIDVFSFSEIMWRKTRLSQLQ